MASEETDSRRSEILRYLGCLGRPLPPGLEQQIDRCDAAVGRAARPRAVTRILPAEQAGCLQGDDLRRHLAGCGQVCLMAATLGAGVERLLMRAQVENMADALIMDACAAAQAEALCDQTEQQVRAGAEARGLWLTSRFSPGYGDWPLTCQGPLLRLLDAGRRIGLAVSGSGILIPRKSVTAVMGFSPVPTVPRGRCEGCSMRQNCQFFREGTRCDQ